MRCQFVNFAQMLFVLYKFLVKLFFEVAGHIRNKKQVTILGVVGCHQIIVLINTHITNQPVLLLRESDNLMTVYAANIIIITSVNPSHNIHIK